MQQNITRTLMNDDSPQGGYNDAPMADLDGQPNRQNP